MDDISLRDYFAAKAMQSLLVNNPLDYSEDAFDDTDGQVDSIACEAYRMADAMLVIKPIKEGKN